MDKTIKEFPHDLDAELAVLGVMMLSDEGISIAEEILNAEDFYDKRNQEIFRSIINLSAKNIKVDPILILEDLKKRDLSEEIGGLDYIMGITAGVYYLSQIRHYANIVEEKSTLRKLIVAADQIISMSYEDTKERDEIVEISEKLIFDITQKSHDDGLVRVGNLTSEVIKNMSIRSSLNGDITGVTTGLVDLDNMLSGLQKSDLVLLAARPSMGKTALGVNIAVNASLNENHVAIFSLEMSKMQLMQRIISQLSFVDLTDIITGNISDWDEILTTISALEKIDLYIDDTPSISLSELRAKCRRLKAEKGLDLIVIDYLQLMTTKGRTENRQLEISAISRGLKALAKELNAPVLALAQLSRAPELRQNKRPILSDLRESGAIEQDADVVMMLYRDDYYNENSEIPNTCDVIIAKHRNGQTGSVRLFYKKTITRFADMLKDGKEE
ncbi:replicative DNA helicase [Citroniella saccharovorans]|uniref:Replicative DNA helicase n=1 Tax=Citroniella saccharovorans TaxID=2053367 RepID=A0AAW9MVJ9_9FIRM|nr:replicative DNA helicase [Citroniella saccharovorans]MEB3428512.1 replicative DNA helicase [Citroniella saccharovorans]